MDMKSYISWIKTVSENYVNKHLVNKFWILLQSTVTYINHLLTYLFNILTNCNISQSNLEIGGIAANGFPWGTGAPV